MLQLVPKALSDSGHKKDLQLREKRFRLARLLRYTEEILRCAQKGDWESVEEMERTRKTEIIDCFKGQNIDDSPLIAEALATLIHLNKQITGLVRQAKYEILSNRNMMQQGRRAALDYQHNSGSL